MPPGRTSPSRLFPTSFRLTRLARSPHDDPWRLRWLLWPQAGFVVAITLVAYTGILARVPWLPVPSPPPTDRLDAPSPEPEPVVAEPVVAEPVVAEPADSPDAPSLSPHAERASAARTDRVVRETTGVKYCKYGTSRASRRFHAERPDSRLLGDVVSMPVDPIGDVAACSGVTI